MCSSWGQKYVKIQTNLKKNPACAVVWHKLVLSLHRETKNRTVMRNTDYNLDTLCGFLSADASLQALKDIISDLDLECLSVNPL